MSVGTLTISIRNQSGKGPARQLRSKGLVPGVCYGASTDGPIEPLQVEVDVKALRAALDPVRKQNTVIKVSLEDGGKLVRELAVLVKDYQVHPLRREITHVDFLAIDPDKQVNAVVPLEFIGKPAGIVDGGVLHTVMRSLEVRCKPADIPTKLTLDVSPLGIGDVLHVSDVALPAGVVSVTGGREAVITLTPPDKDEAPVAEAAAVTEAAPAAAGKDAKAAPAGKDAKAAAPAGKDAKGGAKPAAAAAKPAAKPAAKK